MRRAVLPSLLCAATALLGACGGASGPPEEVLAELDSLGRAPNRLLALSTALVAPGTLLVIAPDDNLLNAIAQRLGTETNECAVRTQVPGTLTATFPTSGCTLATGVVSVAGTMTITIARDGKTVRVLDTFDLTVDGEALKGELVLVTTDGNAYTYTALASIAAHDFKIPMFGGGVQDSTTQVTTTGTEPAGTATRSLTWTAVTQRLSACQARAGSIRIASPSEGVDRTLTYLDETPQTGKAQLLDNGTTTTVTLPRIASCPPLPSS